MADNLSRKIIAEHLVEGEMRVGSEIALGIDQVLWEDATGSLCAFQLEAMGVDDVRTEVVVAYVDHLLVEGDSRNGDDHLLLRSAAQRFGLWFSPAGNGTSHPVHQQRFGIPGNSYVDRAREWSDRGGSAIVGGRNYGQGSSREQAALAVRNLGVHVVLAQSIARIHGENLVNYGVLPLIFVDPGDAERVEVGVTLRLRGLHGWLRGGAKEFELEYGRGNQGGNTIRVCHQLSARQVDVLLAGGAMPWYRHHAQVTGKARGASDDQEDDSIAEPAGRAEYSSGARRLRWHGCPAGPGAGLPGGVPQRL